MVMPGHRDRPFGQPERELVAGHPRLYMREQEACRAQDVDCRDKPGNDGLD